MCTNEKPENPLSKRRLVAENFPYLFTLIVGFISFQYNEIVSDFKSCPVIEYNMIKDSTTTFGTQSKTFYNYTLTNISNKILFKNLFFRVAFKTDITHKRCITAVDEITFHPAPILADTLQPKIIAGGLGATYMIHNFQPETKYQLMLSVDQDHNDKQMPYLYLDTSEPAILYEASFYTYIIKNQLTLNIVILLSLIVVLFCYFIFLKNRL